MSTLADKDPVKVETETSQGENHHDGATDDQANLLDDALRDDEKPKAQEESYDPAADEIEGTELRGHRVAARCRWTG